MSYFNKFLLINFIYFTNNNTVKTKKTLIISLLILLLFIVIFISMFFVYLYLIPVNYDKSKLNANEAKISLFDDNFEKIETNYDKYVKYEEIPKKVINAFLAIEDKRFFNHKGVDYIRILGSLKNNLLYKTKQGGSTITQQLVKNTYLTSDKSMDRKIKEIKLAIQIEKDFSKEEILEKYLNMLYFGSGIYGVKNASERFFAKDLNELSYEEAALLAGIVKSPTKYNPINNYDNSIARMSIVLNQMKNLNFISNDEFLESKKHDIVIKNDLNYNNTSKDYSEIVYFEASKQLNIDSDILPYLDIKINTFYDKNTQKILIDTLNNNLYKLDNNQNKIGLIVDNKSCGVKAFYSSNNANPYLFLRNPGSTIKPFCVFSPALDKGCHLFTKFNNSKTSFDGYTPSNYNNKYSDYATIEESLVNSYNVASCEVLDYIGIDSALDVLNKMHIPYVSQDNSLSLALGGMTYGINFLDLIGAYTTFSNAGMHSKTTFIKSIFINDNCVYKYDNNKTRIFSKETASLINIALKNCAKYGTASKLNCLNFDIASKTGTVQAPNSKKNTDIYNISYTDDISSLFWCGSNTNEYALNSIYTGGGITTCMAKDFYLKYYKNTYPSSLYKSENIKKVELDSIHYKNNNYILASSLSPKCLKTSVFIDNLKNDLKQDFSYENIDNLNYDIIFENDKYHVRFKSNPRLCYKILKADGYDVNQIDNIKYLDKNVEFEIKKKEQFIIIPYYLSNNEEIIGTPKKVFLF